MIKICTAHLPDVGIQVLIPGKVIEADKAADNRLLAFGASLEGIELVHKARNNLRVAYGVQHWTLDTLEELMQAHSSDKWLTCLREACRVLGRFYNARSTVVGFLFCTSASFLTSREVCSNQH